jgi:hypothetical protein
MAMSTLNDTLSLSNEYQVFDSHGSSLTGVLNEEQATQAQSDLMAKGKFCYVLPLGESVYV